ncbi:hypothetical protein ACFVUW_10355 [Streptomyces xiamenensis]|uniref:hypothetical protein n=1 Tax=Streptomyces xiamenensis TaxID=408015 RepID=UPI0036E95515
MSVIALVSGKSSGVTCSALALALASPRPSLLVEADPAGGTIRTGYLGGVGSAATGLHRLAAADRQGTLAGEFQSHLYALDREGQRLLLPGLTHPAQAASMARTWDQLGTMLAVMDESGYDVIIDAGRIVGESESRLNTTSYPAALLRRADVVLLVVRNTQTSLNSAAPAVRLLREDLAHQGTGADALAFLVIEEGVFSASNIQQALNVPVAGLLAWDPATAEIYTHGAHKKTSRALPRSARSAHGPINELVTRRRAQLNPAGLPLAARRAS